MSICINFQSLTMEQRKKIAKDLTVVVKPSGFSKFIKLKYIYPFEIDEINDNIYIPFGYTMKHNLGIRPIFPKYNIEFKGTLRDNQISIKNELFNQIQKKGSSIISAYPGCGKTCIAIYTAKNLRVKTMIIVNRIVLIQQWKQSIIKFCGDKDLVQIVTGKTKKLNENSFFYIMNAQNVSKHPISFYKTIGFLCIDECHLIMAEQLSKCMLHVCPRYVIGLSATPYRKDGLNQLIDLYFGNHKIHRDLNREHKVYKVITQFTPKEVKSPFTGKINWGSILDQQANDISRNNLILSILKKYKERNFLVLCKRIKQGEYLIEQLKEMGESVTSLLGKQQTFDVSSRILIGTASKAGVGFDHPKLDALLLAGDIKSYFIQYLGRVLRTPNVVPIIFDLVDNNNTLKSHFYSRRKIYINHGGHVEKYKI